MEATKVKELDYNPFEHRKVKKQNSDARSLANLLKASLGSGILAVPLAFANAGWGVGLVGTIVIALICAYSVHIFQSRNEFLAVIGCYLVVIVSKPITTIRDCLKLSTFELSKLILGVQVIYFTEVKVSRDCCVAVRKPLLNYTETCVVAFSIGPKRLRPFAKAAGIFAEFSLLLTYLGVCCIFTVLIADSMKQLFDKYVPDHVLSVEYYCLILLVPLCCLVQIRYLKWLAPMSLIANVLLVATFFICLYYIFKDELNFSDKMVVGHAARFPAFLSTVIFAMEGIGVVMPVENNMKKPEHFLGCPGVLMIAMTFIMILYATLGLFGYFRYGDTLKGSITLNLPLDDWPAICAKIFIAVSIFFTYPLHFYVVGDVVTRLTGPYIQDKYQNIAQIFGRIAIVCLCGGIGMALPLLEQIINIVGSVFYSILGLIIPGIIDTVLRYENLGKFKWIMWKNFLIALFGICSLISGLTVTILDIIEKVNAKTE